MKKIKNVSGGGNIQPRPQQNNTRIVTTQSSYMPSVVSDGLRRMYSPSSASSGRESAAKTNSTDYYDRAKATLYGWYNKIFGKTTTKVNDEFTAHGIKKFHVPVKPQGDDPDGKAYERYERTMREYMSQGDWPGEPKDVGSAAWNEWHEQSKAYLDWKALTLARKLDAAGEQYGDPLRPSMDDFYQEL